MINVMSDWERTGRMGTGGVVPRALKSVTSLVELGSSIQAGSLNGVQLMTMNSFKSKQVVHESGFNLHNSNTLQ
jgi:hypothetical protein